MSKIIIDGARRLDGATRVHGSKNAVLPILAATVLNASECIIHDAPNLKDVDASIDIIEYIGCTVSRDKNTVRVDSKNVANFSIPDSLMREMRSSVIFLGAILGRCKRAIISFPGGCEIGPRPIDLHLKAFRQLGVVINESPGGYIHCEAENIQGAHVHLDFPSVGATENVMLIATLAKGTTVISNSAKEPEIVDLEKFLNGMGAKISGAGSDKITIEGVSSLHAVEHTVIPDRIVAVTYMFAAAAAGGNVELSNVNREHVGAIVSAIKDVGCSVSFNPQNETLRIASAHRPKAIDIVRTLPYPGFPTDAQSPFLPVLALAQGTSIVVENIFENRFNQVEELKRMGADITIDGRIAVIRGVSSLYGAKVNATDLRGGAALVVAGLAAHGTTEIRHTSHIDRGYENLCHNFSALGAHISRID